MKGNIKKLAFDGLKWQIGANTVNRVISFAAMLILARFLGPSVFGLYALTISVVNSFELFKSMGLDTALIRRKDDFDRAADTAFFIIPLLGLLLYFAMAFSAPSISAMFKNGQLALTMRILGVAFVCNCFTRVPSAILEHRMEFKKLSIAEFFTNAVFPLVAVPLALGGVGIWSLVIAYVLKMMLYMILVWKYAAWRPSARFSPAIAGEMFHFGKFIFLASVVYFLKMNLDNILVGKYLGVTLLGLYALAFNIANFPVDYFGTKVHRVMYSAYAAIDGEETRLVAAFLKTLKYLAMVALPIGIGVIMLGDDFLGLVYGPKWLAAGGALKILAVAGLFNTLPVGIPPVFLAKGKSWLGFLIMSVQVGFFLALIRPCAARWGIQGVSAVVAGASLVSAGLSFFLVRRVLALKAAQLYASIKTALVSSIAMGAAILVMKNALLGHRPLIGAHASFVLIALCAALTYALVLIRFEKSLLKEIREVAL